MRWDTHVHNVYGATMSDIHAHAKKRVRCKKRALRALAATSRLLRTPGARLIVKETVDGSARKKRRWGPDGTRQQAR